MERKKTIINGIELIYYESYKSEKDARTRETKLKQHRNSFKELKKRIDDSLKDNK